MEGGGTRGCVLDLPVEVAQHVLSFLPPFDLFQASHACTAWWQLARDEWIWERVLRRTYGGPRLFAVPKRNRKRKEKGEKKEEGTPQEETGGDVQGEGQDDETEVKKKEEEEEGEEGNGTWREACLRTAHIERMVAWFGPVGHKTELLQWAVGCGRHRLAASILADLEVSKHHRPAADPQWQPELNRLLGKAASVGYEKVVRVLLRYGADPSAKANLWDKQIIINSVATNPKHLGVIEVFLDLGHITDPGKVLVQLKRRTGRKLGGSGSLAHQTAALGHVRLMEALLTSAASTQPDGPRRRAAVRDGLLCALDSRGRAPLHHAIAQGRAEMVSLLLRHGADVDQVIPGSPPQTPIGLAIVHGHVDIVRALVKYGASLAAPPPPPPTVNASDGRRGPVPLSAIHVACSVCSPEIAELLLSSNDNGRKVDINSRLVDGRTPLHQALKHVRCRPDMIERMVDVWGADLHAEDQRGHNAWHHLCAGRPSEEKVRLVAWLRERGVKLRTPEPLFLLLNHLEHRHPRKADNIEAAVKMVSAMWRMAGGLLGTDGQKFDACLSAARCHPTILAQLFSKTSTSVECPSSPGIEPAIATRVLGRIVRRGFINGYEWHDPFALENAALLVREGGADVNARVSYGDVEHDVDVDDSGRGGDPVCFGVTWFDFKMLHLLQDQLGADLRARNAMGDTLLAHYLRPTTTACPATTVPSHDPMSDVREMGRFMSWLAHLVKRRGVEGSLAGIYLDLGRPEYARWPAWAKVLVRTWITDPTRGEFDWDSNEVIRGWPWVAVALARHTNEPLW